MESLMSGRLMTEDDEEFKDGGISVIYRPSLFEMLESRRMKEAEEAAQNAENAQHGNTKPATQKPDSSTTSNGGNPC